MKRYYTTAFNEAFKMCASRRLLPLAVFTLFTAAVVLPFYILFQLSLAVGMLPFWLLAKGRQAVQRVRGQ